MGLVIVVLLYIGLKAILSHFKALIIILCVGVGLIGNVQIARAEVWKITHYCSCPKCCGKYADGITASGKKVVKGMGANNWLEFGTKLYIEGYGIITIEDRGAKRYFGSKSNHIKAVDVYISNHQEALSMGVVYADVEIIIKEEI